MVLKEIRKKFNLTQKEAASMLGVSLRSFKSYENDIDKENTYKYRFLVEELTKLNRIDEEHGVLSIAAINGAVKEVLEKYDVNFCYLFGCYAKGTPNNLSDVDLLIDTSLTGLDFFGLVEELRENLHKKVDVLKIDQLDNNQELLREIMKNNIKIYG